MFLIGFKIIKNENALEILDFAVERWKVGQILMCNYRQLHKELLRDLLA